jgi:hypothetical protein
MQNAEARAPNAQTASHTQNQNGWLARAMVSKLFRSGDITDPERMPSAATQKQKTLSILRHSV